jgi:hypothetical protein
MNRSKTIGILMAGVILAHASIASAQRWGRGATPRSGACFYEDINFGGRYFCSSAGNTTSAVPPGMNDRISSVRLFGNSTVTLYRDENFRGPSKIVSSDVGDLRGFGFNDRLSSYSVGNAGFYGSDGNAGVYGSDRRIVRERGRVAGTTRGGWNQAESMVRRSYRNVLGREPDPSGLQSWTQQVMNNNWTQRDLENALRQSDEYRASRFYGRR